MRISQPSGSIKLTNVSIVKLKRGGKRFEIACYKNKVLEWRSKLEKDLDNVIQIESVFINVSKGQLANNGDLEKAFKTSDVKKIILEILEKGELQVGEKERTQVFESLNRDIANTIAEKTINPETKRPYTATMIEKVLSDIHFNINPNRNAKQQALEAIRQIQENNIIPIARVQMKIRIFMPSKDAKKVKETILKLLASVESEEVDEDFELVGVIDPGNFKILSELISKETKGKGLVEMLAMNDVDDLN
ncbi:SBDS protein C-terminal domain-containing protein [Globomyces pollinis-pini]|nr:SBDS protein C-terminal domain-containing protein [Globomyces pollinis-pini]